MKMQCTRTAGSIAIKRAFLMLVLTGAAALGPISQADATALTAYTFSGGFQSTASATYGFRFTTNDSIGITSLGIVDSGLDGLNHAHDVGIWTDSGVLLASVSVAGGTADPLIDGFRFADIPMLVLAASGTYRIGALFTLGDGDNTLQGVGRAPVPEITFTDSLKWTASGSVLTFPTNTSGPTTAAANFRFETIPVPAPATLALLGLGLAGLGFGRRKRT